MFKHVSPALTKILKGMLEFNPYFRLTVDQALESAVFDKIREPHFEQPCPVRIKHKIFEDGAFDYERGESAVYSIKDYKKMLVKELKKLRK